MSGVQPFIRATCNPDARSWVRDLVKPYLLPDGYSNPDISGSISHLLIDDASFFFTDKPSSETLDFTYISADVWDNPKLLQNNPAYLRGLKGLPHVERDRFLGKKGFGGNWNTKLTTGDFFKSSWFQYVDPHEVPQLQNVIRFWDLSGGKAIAKGDWTVGAKLGISICGNISSAYSMSVYILDILRERKPPPLINQLILSTSSLDGRVCKVRWEMEPGASGVRDSSTLQSILSGFDARGIRSTSSKYSRWSALSSAVEAGNVFIVRAKWNQEFTTELENLPSVDHDDQADASSSAYLALCSPSGISSGKYSY